MGNVDGRAVPYPANKDVWESWVQHLLGEKYGTQANAYGRGGQKQDGLDLIVYDRAGQRIGVQCKFVSQGSKLDVQVVEDDLKASRVAGPPISRFVLYTSAQSDTKTVDALDKLRPLAQSQNVEFDYLLWRDFEEEVRRYDLFDRLQGLPARFAEVASARPPADTLGLAARPTVAVAAVAGTLFSQMLDDARDALLAGDPASATAIVDSLLKRPEKLPDAEQPDLRHGRRAQALLCEDKYEEALVASGPGLELQPPSVLSALAALIAGQNLGRREEIDSRLSGRLKQDRDVSLLRGHLAMVDGDFSLARDIVDALWKEHSGDLDLVVMRADLMLHRVLGHPGTKRMEIAGGAERRALEAAIPLYRQSLERRDPLASRSTWGPAAVNLVTCLKLLQRDREAADVAERVIATLGTEVDEYERLVLALAEGGKAKKVLEITAGMTDASPRLLLARVCAYLNLNEYGEAEKLLLAVQPRATDLDVENVAWMLFGARMHGHPASDIVALADDYYEHSVRKLSACRRIVELAADRGHKALIEKYSRKAVELYRASPEPEYLLFVVDSMLNLELLDEAIELLMPSVDLDAPQGGPLEQRLAYCLLHRRRLESLHKLLSGLPTDITDTAAFDSYRIDYQLFRGDQPAALDAIRVALTRKPSDLRLQALHINLLRQDGKIDEARQQVLATEFRANAPMRAVALYVREARRLGESSRADDFAYRWIRDNGDESENAAWFLMDILASRRQQQTAALDQVTTHCGVLLAPTKPAGAPHWLVIDDRFGEDLAAGWYSTSSDHVDALIGKAAQTVVDFPVFPGGPFEIQAVLPVVDGAYQLLQGRYGRQLPMVSALRTVPVKGEGDKYDFSAIFKILDDNKAATLNALSEYEKNPLPLSVLATLMGRNPIDAWGSLVGTEHSIRAMSGDGGAVARFAARLEQGRPDVVLDPLALAGLSAFGLLEVFLQSVQSIAMTASAVRVIRDQRATIAMTPEGQGSIVLGASDQQGRYTRMEIPAEVLAEKRKALDILLEWIGAHVAVIPVPPSGIREDAFSAISTTCAPYVADSMQLAGHLKRVLVADDLGVELFSVSLGVSQVPVLALLRSACRSNLITQAQYSRAMVSFCRANYEFVSFNADDLLALTDLEADSVTSTPDVVALLDYLRFPSLDLNCALRVVFSYLAKLVAAEVSRSYFRGCVTAALSALTRHATRETQQVGVMFVRAARTLPKHYSDEVMNALDRWLRGHFLTFNDFMPDCKKLPPELL